MLSREKMRQEILWKERLGLRRQFRLELRESRPGQERAKAQTRWSFPVGDAQRLDRHWASGGQDRRRCAPGRLAQGQDGAEAAGKSTMAAALEQHRTWKAAWRAVA